MDERLRFVARLIVGEKTAMNRGRAILLNTSTYHRGIRQ